MSRGAAIPDIRKHFPDEAFAKLLTEYTENTEFFNASHFLCGLCALCEKQEISANSSSVQRPCPVKGPAPTDKKKAYP